MSKLSAKQNKIAQALMQKHGKDEIFVKIANGQMYFSKHSAQVGLSDTEFKEQFECVKRKAESKEPEKNLTTAREVLKKIRSQIGSKS